MSWKDRTISYYVSVAGYQQIRQVSSVLTVSILLV
jgi:hypothetical protein